MLGAVDWPPGAPGPIEFTKPTPALLTSTVEKTREGAAMRFGKNVKDVLT